jgi:hypothetical protein
LIIYASLKHKTMSKTDQIQVFTVEYADSWGWAKWGENKLEREKEEKEKDSGTKRGRWFITRARHQLLWHQTWHRHYWRQGLCHASTTSASMPTCLRTLTPNALALRRVILAPITTAPSWGFIF